MFRNRSLLSLTLFVGGSMFFVALGVGLHEDSMDMGWGRSLVLAAVIAAALLQANLRSVRVTFGPRGIQRDRRRIVFGHRQVVSAEAIQDVFVDHPSHAVRPRMMLRTHAGQEHRLLAELPERPAAEALATAIRRSVGLTTSKKHG